MSCVWDNGSGHYVIASKGAPEAIMNLCNLDYESKEKVVLQSKEAASRSFRVLGVAKAVQAKGPVPEQQTDFKFQWVGLIALEDPLRPEVPGAVALCKKAGIRVIMITGDYPETANKIAEQAGLDSMSGILSGSKILSMSDDELRTQLRMVNIFARILPEQKLRIVKALQSDNHVVAMTGDGVNDAPSLKRANVGIAMGGRGTDVARESSDIVLTDDNFASIVSGIQRGRTIFSNIRKAMSFIVAVHVPIAGLSILPLIFGWPLILLPVHIAFMELIIDPACTLLFEAQDTENAIMNKPPRSLHDRLFSPTDLLRSSLQGLFILLMTALVFALAFTLEKSSEWARAVTFSLLVLSNIGLIFADLTAGSFAQLKNAFKKFSIRLTLPISVLTLLVINQLPIVQNLFAFQSLHFSEFLAVIFLSLVIFMFIFIWNSKSLKQA
jgi:P-type Ca2+ transporter type 2C